jgi:hypothetical protein
VRERCQNPASELSYFMVHERKLRAGPLAGKEGLRILYAYGASSACFQVDLVLAAQKVKPHPNSPARGAS